MILPIKTSISQGMVQSSGLLPETASQSSENPSVDVHRFADLIQEGVLSADFALGLHEATLDALFDTWALHPSLCLIDLLGLEISQGLNLLQSELNSATKTKFYSSLFLIYISCKRFSLSYEFINRGSDGFQSLYNTNIKNQIKKLLEVRREAELASIEKQRKHTSNPILKPETQAYLKSQSERQRKSLQAAIDFLVFLVKVEDPKARLLLLLRKLHSLKGAERLLKEPSLTFLHLKQYLNHSEMLFSESLKASVCPFAGLNFRFLAVGKSEKELKGMLIGCDSIVKSMQGTAAQQLKSLHEILSGQLTHDGWLKQTGIKKVSVKTQEQFLETMYVRLETAIMFISFVKDVYTIIDESILPKIVSNWVPHTELTQRFWGNFFLLRLRRFAIQEGTASPLQVIRKYVVEHFSHVFQMLEDLQTRTCSQNRILLDFFQSLNGIDEEPLMNMEGLQDSKILSAAPISLTDISLPPSQAMCPIVDAFRDAIYALPKLQKKMKSELQLAFYALPEQDRNFSDVQRACLLVSLPLCRLSFLFNDYLALSGKRDEIDCFPDLLAGFIELDELDLKFSPCEPIDETPPLLTSMPEETSEVQEPIEIPKLEDLSLQEKEVGPPLEFATTTNVEPIKIESLKVRKVLNQLYALGFFRDRQNGSHLILKKDPKGTHVSVPLHEELKDGTRAGIEKQVNEALGLL